MVFVVSGRIFCCATSSFLIITKTNIHHEHAIDGQRKKDCVLSNITQAHTSSTTEKKNKLTGMRSGQKTNAKKNIVFFFILFLCFQVPVAWLTVAVGTLQPCADYRRYTRFYVLTIRYRLVVATSAMCYGQRTTHIHSSQRHSATHHLLCEKLSDFFPIRFCSTRWCLYLGHPMRTVLFLVLDRPAISQLTYHSNSSQPGNARRTNVYELCIRSLYTALNTHERTFFSSRRCRTNRKMCSTLKVYIFFLLPSGFGKKVTKKRLPYFVLEAFSSK